ncbi:MAG: cupin domain-containing protein [Clostridia bacterium]|nr:cupin domain-containing protein [Clostridia bacterium]
MIEKVYTFNTSTEKLVEKIVDDDNLALNHMILPKDTGLPVHHANSNVYMMVVRGCLTLKLGEQPPKEYKAGQIVNIPYKTKMEPKNVHQDVLEFFVVKAPNPRDMK